MARQLLLHAAGSRRMSSVDHKQTDMKMSNPASKAREFSQDLQLGSFYFRSNFRSQIPLNFMGMQGIEPHLGNVLVRTRTTPSSHTFPLRLLILIYYELVDHLPQGVFAHFVCHRCDR